jgi:phage shock protein PspC (stress-responsive transcriptional regulator)
VICPSVVRRIWILLGVFGVSTVFLGLASYLALVVARQEAMW